MNVDDKTKQAFSKLQSGIVDVQLNSAARAEQAKLIADYISYAHLPEDASESLKDCIAEPILDALNAYAAQINAKDKMLLSAQQIISYLRAKIYRTKARVSQPVVQSNDKSTALVNKHNATRVVDNTPVTNNSTMVESHE